MRMLALILLCALAMVSSQDRPARPVRRPAAGMAPVSGPSPFDPACNGPQSGVNYHNGPVEPFVAVDPRDPAHFVGVWQQDRWSNGGASGIMTGVSRNGGLTWSKTAVPFSQCTGGPYTRVSDPWVTISPDGTVYQVTLGLADANNTTAVVVSRSGDGGFTWGSPVTLIQDTTTNGNDKESIAADSTDSHYVYAVWDRSGGNSTPAWFARTTDGGATWEAARDIYNPGNGGGAYSNQIAVLPNGVLVDLFILARSNASNVAILRSQDHGQTWSPPVGVSIDDAIGAVNPKTQKYLRTGGLDIAVDRASGAMYVVWDDARFSGNAREGVVMSKSLDGGNSWSAPVQVNQAPEVQAFNSAVAVSADGSVAITYYDFRNDTPDPGTLLTNCWRIVSHDGGNSWTETALAGPFDMLSAPLADSPFVGDYQGLTAAGNDFLAFFVIANSGNADMPSSVFARSGAGAAASRGNGHREVNLRPRSFWDRLDRKPGGPR